MHGAWQWEGRTWEVRWEEGAPGRYRVRVGDWTGEVDEVVLREGGEVLLRQGDRWHRVWVAVAPEGVWVAYQGRTWWLRRAEDRRRGGEGRASPRARDGRLRAPVPAQVREVRVRPGQTVAQGDVLVVLEAMKMEFRLQAPFPGVVRQVLVEPGQVVEREALVVELQPEDAAGEGPSG